MSSNGAELLGDSATRRLGDSATRRLGAWSPEALIHIYESDAPEVSFTLVGRRAPIQRVESVQCIKERVRKSRQRASSSRESAWLSRQSYRASRQPARRRTLLPPGARQPDTLSRQAARPSRGSGSEYNLRLRRRRSVTRNPVSASGISRVRSDHSPHGLQISRA
jgi:hypothetical protein